MQAIQNNHLNEQITQSKKLFSSSSSDQIDKDTLLKITNSNEKNEKNSEVVAGVQTPPLLDKDLAVSAAAVVAKAVEQLIADQQKPVESSEKQLNMRDQIYCTGSLLDAVQSAKIFGDCKHFVDMPLKRDAESVLVAWNLLSQGVEAGQIDPAVLHRFVSEHFDNPGGELEDYHPTDFNSEEQFNVITDPHYRAWAQELHRKWPTLCRRVSEKVLSDPDRYSLIPVPKPFVVPGGRFREMYYWDSFFTIKGLLASGMFATVRGMIENMCHLIKKYGFVPNGNRVYYLNRSQPPLLTWCLHAYYKATDDVEFVRSTMVWLEKEMEFFTNNKKFHRSEWKAPLFRYHVVAHGPRPESYREDVESAIHIVDSTEKRRLWGDIAAAAESGRDFSSRWFHNEGPMAGKMGSTRTSSILPVDLNSIICGNLRIFAEFYECLGEHEAAKNSKKQFLLMRDTIHQIFWSEEDGCWFDYNIITQSHIKVYFDTNFFPLFTGCVHENFNPQQIVDYLSRAGVLVFPGGLPTSLITSGQQWDFPNAWAPTTWVIIQGLRLTGQTELAKTIADKWIRRNYALWLNTGGRMFEKYNVATDCVRNAGGGGEYEVQEGFGWTNGVILDLLLTYGNELKWKPNDSDKTSEEKVEITSNCECCRPIWKKVVAEETINDDELAATIEKQSAAVQQQQQPVIIIVPNSNNNVEENSLAQQQQTPTNASLTENGSANQENVQSQQIFIVTPDDQLQQKQTDDTSEEDKKPSAPIIIVPSANGVGLPGLGKTPGDAIIIMPAAVGAQITGAAIQDLQQEIQYLQQKNDDLQNQLDQNEDVLQQNKQHHSNQNDNGPQFFVSGTMNLRNEIEE